MKKNITHQTVLNEPSDAAKELPFFNLLPKDEAGLLQWRIYVLTRCNTDPEFRDDIWQMCKQDVCFFAATFMWLHETRDDAFTKQAGKFPFRPWGDQVDCLAWLQLYGGKYDMTVEKTRGIGLSWVAITFLLWKWLTLDGSSIDLGILSKDDKSLDVMGRPGTLMGKLDVAFESLPGWMQIGPDGKSILHRTYTNHRFEHRVNGNAIIGFTASDEKLRSSRLNLIIIDEAAFLPVDSQRWLAASQFVSSSRIFVSTHNGSAAFFYRMTKDTKSRLVRIQTWWQANPARAQGMYIVKAGQVHILDKDYEFPEGYEFCYDTPGLERSPWVDGEFEKAGADKISLMQEIYGTAALYTKKLFQPNVIDIMVSTAKPPARKCRLTSFGEFIEDLDGEWRFWQDQAIPFDSRYSVGFDPAIGVAGKAMAGLVAIDERTGEVVVTAALPDVNAVEQARAVECLCKLLCGSRGASYAQVVPESTGIGVAFLTELRRLRWPNIYKDGNKTGVHNRDKGEVLLIEFGRAVLDGEVLVTDHNLVEDLESFEYDQKFELVFTGEVGHGDIGQAAALAWHGCKVRRRAIIEAQNPKEDENLLPIEREPNYNERRRNRQIWSTRFARN